MILKNLNSTSLKTSQPIDTDRINAMLAVDDTAALSDEQIARREVNEYRRGWLAGIEQADEIEAVDGNYADAIAAAESSSDGSPHEHRGKIDSLRRCSQIAERLADEPSYAAEALSWFRIKSESWRNRSIDAEPPTVDEAYKRVSKRLNPTVAEISAEAVRELRTTDDDREDGIAAAKKAKRLIRIDDASSQPLDCNDIAGDAEDDRELGYISELMRYNLANAPKPQPVFALAGALSLMASLVGRKVVDEFDNWTNLQIISVGETSSGKDFGRQLNDKILTASGNTEIIAPEEVTSDSSLYKTLALYPNRLAQFDEFGRFLQTASNSKQGWLFQVVTAMLKLYQGCNRDRFFPKGYADKKANPDYFINHPHLVLHGTSTPEAIYCGLGTSAEDDGFLGRCLIFESIEQPRKTMRPRKPIPDSLIRAAEFWREFGDSNLSDVSGADPVTVVTTPEAMKAFDRLDEISHNHLVAKGRGSKLWGRADQKARQVALVVACSRLKIDEPGAVPVVDEFSAKWSCELVAAITRHMQSLSVRWLASNKLEADHQKILRLIEAAEPYGLTQTELTRKTQWTTRRERIEMLNTLIESRLIGQAGEEDGKPARWRMVPGSVN